MSDHHEACGCLTDGRNWLRECRYHKEMRTARDKGDAVIKAATLCNFCPSEGGYKKGQSVEDCYEQLSEAVNEYYGVDLDAYDHPWWTEEEMWTALGKKP